MQIRISRNWTRKSLVPLGPIFVFQECVRTFQRADFGQSQLLHQAVLRGQKAPFHAAFGLRRQRQNRADAQLPQCTSQLCQAVRTLTLVFGFALAQRHCEHGIPIRVNLHHPAVLFQVLPKNSHVEVGRIAFYKPAPTPTGRVIDHAHQMPYRSAPFQPIVFRCVPLHQLPEPASAWPPAVHIFELARFRLP